MGAPVSCFQLHGSVIRRRRRGRRNATNARGLSSRCDDRMVAEKARVEKTRSGLIPFPFMDNPGDSQAAIVPSWKRCYLKCTYRSTNPRSCFVQEETNESDSVKTVASTVKLRPWPRIADAKCRNEQTLRSDDAETQSQLMAISPGLVYSSSVSP